MARMAACMQWRMWRRRATLSELRQISAGIGCSSPCCCTLEIFRAGVPRMPSLLRDLVLSSSRSLSVTCTDVLAYGKYVHLHSCIRKIYAYVYACMHTHIHTCTHKYECTYLDDHKHACFCALTCTHIKECSTNQMECGRLEGVVHGAKVTSCLHGSP